MSREIPPDPAAAPIRVGTRLVIAVPRFGSLFEGHFPGRPILPGIGLLDLARRALAAAGASPALREIPVLRLRRLVSPGERLELEVKALGPGGRIRVEVSRAAEIVASCILVPGEPAPGPPRVGPVLSAQHTAVASDLDKLLPQRPPMRFVERIEAETDAGVTCAVRVPERSAFAEGRSAPALVALEMAAQSTAVFEALRRSREAQGRGARIGYLVGARDVRFSRAWVPAGGTLLAAVRLSGIVPPLSTYAFEVTDDGGVIASGTVSTWLTATAA